MVIFELQAAFFPLFSVFFLGFSSSSSSRCGFRREAHIPHLLLSAAQPRLQAASALKLKLFLQDVKHLWGPGWPRALPVFPHCLVRSGRGGGEGWEEVGGGGVQNKGTVHTLGRDPLNGSTAHPFKCLLPTPVKVNKPRWCLRLRTVGGGVAEPLKPPLRCPTHSSFWIQCISFLYEPRKRSIIPAVFFLPPPPLDA